MREILRIHIGGHKKKEKGIDCKRGWEGQHTFEEGMMRDFPKEQPGDFWEDLYEGMENEQKGRVEQKKRTERRVEQKEEQDKKGE